MGNTRPRSKVGGWRWVSRLSLREAAVSSAGETGGRGLEPGHPDLAKTKKGHFSLLLHSFFRKTGDGESTHSFFVVVVGPGNEFCKTGQLSPHSLLPPGSWLYSHTSRGEQAAPEGSPLPGTLP